MGTSIRVCLDDVVVDGELNDSPAAQEILALLPIEGDAHGFGGEISVEVALVRAPHDDATNRVPRGTLAYWAPGRCLTLFVGKTPLTAAEAGEDDPVIATSAVDVVGAIDSPGALVGMERPRRMGIMMRDHERAG